jgi:hypothetical protein
VNEIVEVIVDLKGIPAPSRGCYAVLCDRSINYLERFSAKHPLCFVFPFYTKGVRNIPDFSTCRSSRIFLPWYVGNLKPMKKLRNLEKVRNYKKRFVKKFTGILKFHAILFLQET